jgi:hypothetical protein
MAKNLSVPLKNIAKTIRNVASKLAPRDTGNLRNVLRSYNTPERMTKIDKNGGAQIVLFFAPPGAKYGKYWNKPYGRGTGTTATIRKRYPANFDYAEKAYKSPEVKTAVKNYTKALGKSIATELREAVRKG